MSPDPPAAGLPAFDLKLEDDGLATLTFDLPGEKVNKFSRATIRELAEMLLRLDREPRIRGLLVRSGKPDVFIAGADVKEFVSTPPAEAQDSVRAVQALFEQLAHLPFPTVAAINGVCLGGGTELALACDYRVMSDGGRKPAQIGLPEVRLGIFPAWGGCTRLPRVVGLQKALDLILTGRTLDARRAKKVGLVDAAIPVPIFEETARRFARERLGQKKPRERRSERGLADLALESNPLGRKVVFAKARQTVLKQTGGHYPAPFAALAAIEEGYGKPVAAGLEAEARHIANVFGGSVQRNLLNLFFATEEVKKETGVANSSVRPLGVTRVGVLGAGLMGGGIAQLAADRGLPARMKDIDPKALAHGFAAAAAVWREKGKKRRLAPRELSAKMALLSGTLDYTGFARCEVTIEAVVEKLGVKRSVLADWEARVPDTAIFASNTSTLPITEIAAGSRVPSRVVGMHFFNPVHRLPLVEVIRGRESSDETVATVFALAKALGKTPVVVKDSPGFLVNRILAPYMVEAVRLIEEGARIEDVDRAVKEFGMPVGPIALLDDVGLDVALKACDVLAAAFPARVQQVGQAALVAEGRLGRKSGAGFYDYAEPGGKRGEPSREAYRLLGVEPKNDPPFTPAEIEERLILLMINEAAFCLEDGVVTRPAKLDLAMIFGTGFPPFRGGLLRHADDVGLREIADSLARLAGRLGERFAPAASIVRMARSGGGFYSEQPASAGGEAA